MKNKQIEEISDCDSKAYPYEKSHLSATTQNRKFDFKKWQVWFKERKQLRLLLQWLKHRIRKTSLAKYQKRTKETNDETHKDTVCLLALIWLKLHKDPKIISWRASKHKLTRYKQIGYSWCLQKRYTRTEKRRNKNYGPCKDWTHSLCVISTKLCPLS